MAGMLDRAPKPAAANDLAAGCTSTGSPASRTNPVATITFLDVVNYVIDRCGIKRQALAIDAGYSEFQFSRITSGQSGALDFVDRLPYEQQKAIAKRNCERFPELVVTERPTDELIAALVTELKAQTERVATLVAVHELARQRRQS